MPNFTRSHTITQLREEVKGLKEQHDNHWKDIDDMDESRERDILNEVQGAWEENEKLKEENEKLKEKNAELNKELEYEADTSFADLNEKIEKLKEETKRAKEHASFFSSQYLPPTHIDGRHPFGSYSSFTKRYLHQYNLLCEKTKGNKELKEEVEGNDKCEKMIMEIWANGGSYDDALPIHYRQKKENGDYGIDPY